MRAGDVVWNPLTGEKAMIVEASEESIVADFAVEAGGFVPGGEHVHDHRAEHLEVRAGQITFVLGGEDRALAAGERVTVVPGTLAPLVECRSGGGADPRPYRARNALRGGDPRHLGTLRRWAHECRGTPLATARRPRCHALSPGTPLPAAARCCAEAPVPAARRARAATGLGARSIATSISRPTPPPKRGSAASRNT